MSEATGVQYLEDAIQPVISTSGGVYARQRPPYLRPPSLTRQSSRSAGPTDNVGNDDDVDDRDVNQKQV
jgi:hypothetical protein